MGKRSGKSGKKASVGISGYAVAIILSFFLLLLLTAPFADYARNSGAGLVIVVMVIGPVAWAILTKLIVRFVIRPLAARGLWL